MTLLVTVIAAAAITLAWYRKAPQNGLPLGCLALIYWGASLMWLVDAVVAYAELGSQFFTPEPREMLNDLFLGLSAVTFGFLIWLANLLVKDPKGRLKAALSRKK